MPLKCTIWDYQPHLEKDGTFKPVYEYPLIDSKKLSHYMAELSNSSHNLIEKSIGMRKNKRILEFSDWFTENEPDTNEQIPDIYLGFVAISRAIRDCLKLEINRPSIQLKTRVRIRIRDNYICGYCKRPGTINKDPDNRLWHIDHKIPYSFGGSDTDDNLLLACTTCNTQKHNKMYDEFMKIRGNCG